MSHLPGYSNHSFCCYTLSAQVHLWIPTLMTHLTSFFTDISFLLGIPFYNLEELKLRNVTTIYMLQSQLFFIMGLGLSMLYNFFLSDTVITVFGHDVLLLRHLGVPGAVSQLLLCNAMAVSPQNSCYYKRKGKYLRVRECLVYIQN